ncbi:unnamed protein product [Phyllotreta striolata]|uniref:Coiled-coil domain-containing protein 137 n=1 Tax=Phyllotreta striolata TaxID=444603 RepID=A0A9N9XQ89_PHYSR|nr:unnamed protein product [Phyllotreta striolata]
MGRKIPGRKHRGIRDPEKQEAVRFEKIKNKINAPPSNVEAQEMPKTLQRIVELKNRVKNGDFSKKKKKSNSKENKKIVKSHEFERLPGESDKNLLQRVNKLCVDTLKETEFADKYGVEIKRNEDGEIEGVVKKPKDELELLMKQARKKEKAKEKGIKKKKKPKTDQVPIKLSKWQKRKKKLNEKEQNKEMRNIDEFKQYKDNVKFGETAHAPPSLVAPRRVKKTQTPRPGNKNLILKKILGDGKEKPAIAKESRKTINKVIDKKSKRKELPQALRMQLERQQKEVITAYKELKAKKYNK